MIKGPKYIYAAYLHMAAYNATSILSYVNNAISDSVFGEEAEAVTLLEKKPFVVLLDEKPEAEKLFRVMELLRLHFKFLDPMVGIGEVRDRTTLVARPKDYYQLLHDALILLSQLKSDFMHPSGTRAIMFEPTFLNRMKVCFDAARRVVKERFSLADDDIKHLNRFQKNPANPKQHIENPRFPYKFDDVDGQLSDSGLAFFICLFLEKKYAVQFLNDPNMQAFRMENPMGVKVCNEVFSTYRIQMPKIRMDAQNDGIILGLDVLNERKKCPSILFDLLDRNDQESFRSPIDDMLWKRIMDRFPHMVLNFIDQTNAFSRIRFQVTMGTQLLRSYDKVAVDGIKRERIIQKKINGFGKPVQMKATGTKALYLLNTNKIGMYWSDTNPTDCYMPEITKDKVNNPAPVCWLSKYELTPMTFHQLLYNKVGTEQDESTEDIILKYVNNYRRLFLDVSGGKLRPLGHPAKVALILSKEYQLPYTRIPKELQNYLTGKPVDIEERFYKTADDRIANMLKSTKRRLNNINQKEKAVLDTKMNKIGKKHFAEIKPDELALFLANDLLAFQPTREDGRDKLTGLNYQVLRSSLTYFSQYKEQIYRVFVKCRLINSDIAHPFVAYIPKEAYTDIVSFYKAYLREKVQYLLACQAEQRYFNYYFLHVDRHKWDERDHSFYQELAKRYLNQPIELPRGLFADAIKNLLKKHFGSVEPIKEALALERCNTSYLIQVYFQTFYADQEQSFYSFKRSYRLFNMLNDRFKGNRLEVVYYTTEELKQLNQQVNEDIEQYIDNQYRKAVQRSRSNVNRKSFIHLHWNKLKHLLREYKDMEKSLRLYKIQDMILYMIGHSIIPEPTITHDLTITYQQGETINVRMEDLRPEDYGSLRQLLHDRRIPSLCAYFGGRPINHEILKQELSEYDRNRVLVVQLIQNIERNHIVLSDEDQQLLDIIQQSFGSHSYPSPEKLSMIENTWTLPGITEQICAEVVRMVTG